jgi:hypothetical protein
MLQTDRKVQYDDGISFFLKSVPMGLRHFVSNWMMGVSTSHPTPYVSVKFGISLNWSWAYVW